MELRFALDRLAKTSDKRIGKLALKAAIARLDEPITVRPTPLRKRYKPRPGRYQRRLLAMLPRPPVIDPIDRPATWTGLAARIGEDAAAELHRKLAARRPPMPRRSADDPVGDTVFRTSDPI